MSVSWKNSLGWATGGAGVIRAAVHQHSAPAQR